MDALYPTNHGTSEKDNATDASAASGAEERRVSLLWASPLQNAPVLGPSPVTDLRVGWPVSSDGTCSVCTDFIFQYTRSFFCRRSSCAWLTR